MESRQGHDTQFDTTGAGVENNRYVQLVNDAFGSSQGVHTALRPLTRNFLRKRDGLWEACGSR